MGTIKKDKIMLTNGLGLANDIKMQEASTKNNLLTRFLYSPSNRHI
jgi:hypothetical protein